MSKLHAQLWEENKGLVQACLNHPFVQGLKDGSLDPEAFKRYVGQDAFFLKAFFRAYALAAAKCTDESHATLFVTLMQGVLDELALHKAYSKKLEIDLDSVKPFSACRSYIDFLMHTSYQCPLGEITAAMVPCMRLYAFLGQELSKGSYAETYKEWIGNYSSEEFEKLAVELEDLLDSVATDTAAAHDAYRYALQCELDFFQAPLEVRDA